MTSTGGAAVDGAAAPDRPARVVIGPALLLVGVLGTVAVVQRAGQRVPVLVMAREVPAGQVVGDQDVRVAELVSPLAGHPGRRRPRPRGGTGGERAAGRRTGPAPNRHGRRQAGAAGAVAMSVAAAPEHAAAGLPRAGIGWRWWPAATPTSPMSAPGSSCRRCRSSVMAPPPDGGERVGCWSVWR
jgi:Flp pilus assembly protein CpaB